LSSKDEVHISKFLKDLNSTHPIKNVKSKCNGKIVIQPRTCVSSVKMVSSLKKLGVGERKSLIVKPPNIEKQFLEHYWRGVFDGDGCISITGKRKELSLCGNEHMLNGYSKFLKTKGVNSKITPCKSIYRVRHGSREDIFNISSLLYANSTVYLDRKFAIAKSIYENPYFKLRKNSKIKQTCEQAN
jgi:hypothetical protein